MDLDHNDLAFLPLGGTGEIGMNLNLYRCNGKWLAIDCGIGFGGNENPEVEIMMPDPGFIAERRQDLLALVITQHEAGDLDGRLRTFSTMAIVAVLALAGVAVQGGFALPDAAAGWWGLAALTFLYGTAFTIMFTVLPRLGVVGNSAIMNVEPIFALVLAWALLGQSIATVQLAGALLVVATVVWLGLRKGA